MCVCVYVCLYVYGVCSCEHAGVHVLYYVFASQCKPEDSLRFKPSLVTGSLLFCSYVRQASWPTASGALLPLHRHRITRIAGVWVLGM